ncbi:hypothetical protein PENARI_c011G11677 [Penicillium arizonense]|uniref:Uncharacterized protein n=1 Tax=Penicillium arizonense TaxID=1835702 RepID=A0A1F5LFN8_PENAI|nr:hypothetical protein PENARI_c011G11677 [Penicillium arizonense]OGE52033.1 hypothetical protein PENARI_c011G11677 [Penicillium arizonense]
MPALGFDTLATASRPSSIVMRKRFVVRASRNFSTEMRHAAPTDSTATLAII